MNVTGGLGFRMAHERRNLLDHGGDVGDETRRVSRRANTLPNRNARSAR
jgi:hypothetical protein